jgi:hypothetical protein
MTTLKLAEPDVKILLIDILSVYHVEDFARSKLGWIVKDEILQNVAEVIEKFKNNHEIL